MKKAPLKKPLVCILDDDEILTRMLVSQLERRQYRCLPFLKTEDFLVHLDNQEKADIYIVDFFLDSKKSSGLDVCRKIKSRHRAPVIMLTSNKGTDTIVSCLNAGADQYIVKPCNSNELVARMEATMRLYGAAPEFPGPGPDLADRYREHFSVNWLLRTLTVNNGTNVRLTEKELALFELFVVAADRTLNRRLAYGAIYGIEMDPLNRAVDILASRLRRKLQGLDAGIDIVTIRGGGYMLVLPQSEVGADVPS
jgi:DNA-binding response OmpR family regulator